MLLEQLFDKPVDRAIEGVIKADDEVRLYVELDEYVVTNEVAKRLDEFLQAYLDYKGANGVWISGFFGSGKSHLLKMLALLLQNKPIDGTEYPLDIFLKKSPFDEGGMQAEDLKRAVAIPSESILFNIDQKADVISKTELDALIAVFVKVFDEHCGYYAKHAYIAQFERELDADGQFEEFQNAFASLAGRDWDTGRMRAKQMGKHIDGAYSQVTGTEITGILDKYRDDYRLSIEDFAEQVNDYIQTKEPNFRLNFFVDEVGQYIAENVKLMTNLQTVAESLATRCQGRAWVVVTAQQDMSSVLGEGAQQSNDFTKIQARFNNKMPLNSQDVAEVIQRRLLAKRKEHTHALTDLYQKHSNNFKTLFDFADGSTSYHNFNDSDHFVQSYPFVPYQYLLFQSAIQGLSRHNAFQGKSSSVGERSMLGVFQQVAVSIKDGSLGDLATFDAMFEGIRTALTTKIQQSVLNAENTLTNDFAIRVLKALFLVKYVKAFKPTVRNICVLMHDSFDTSITDLKDKVEEALALLENQTLIQRNGEIYEYLTDEEQDVEAEIKNTDIDDDSVPAQLEKLIFDSVIKDRKIRWDDSGQDHPFTRKIDNEKRGRECELAINVITSFHDYRDAVDKHKSDTLYNAELRVVMPENDRLIRDLTLYEKTGKYISHETRSSQRQSVKQILAGKLSQNTERYEQLKVLVSSLLGQSTYFVAGQELDLAGEDGRTKVQRAFVELATHTYPNHKMLHGRQFKESEIPDILTQAGLGLLGEDASLPEAQQEMLAHIQSNDRGGIRTTVKVLLEKFERKPYGWPYAAVLCTLAHLCARGKIEVRQSTNLLDDAELATALVNSTNHGNLILDPQVEFTAGQVRKLKELFHDYFDKVAHSNEAKALATETKQAFSAQKQELSDLLQQAASYPFLRALTPIVDELVELEAKPYPWFINELPRDEDKWLDDFKDKVIEPIQKFMKGPSKSNYDAARSLMNNQSANLSYVTAPEVAAINAALEDPNVFTGNTIQNLVQNTQALEKALESEISSEKRNAVEKIESLEDRLGHYDGFNALSAEQQADVRKPFDEAKQKINSETLIPTIRDSANQFAQNKYDRILETIEALNAPEHVEPIVQPTPTGEPGVSEPNPTPVVPAPNPELKAKFVNSKELELTFKKPVLESEADVDAYLESYKQALVDTISQGKKVRV